MARMEFEFAFTGDASDLKAAGQVAETAISDVSNEAKRSATDINVHATALEKEASAARKAADANAANAAASKRAREEAARAAGGSASAAQLSGTSVQTRTNSFSAANNLGARIEQLRTQFDPAYAAAQRLSSAIDDLAEAERLGVQITGGYGHALDAIILKHDAAAAAAKHQRDEYARLAAAGREAQTADRAQAGFNSVLGVGASTGLKASDSAVIFEEAARAAEQLELKAAALRMQIDPVGAAQKRLNAELVEYSALAQRGAISADELSAAQVMARQRYDDFVDSVPGAGSGPDRNTRNRRQVLGYQGFDIGQGLLGGMPLGMIAAQQGPQVVQLYAGQGGAKTALEDVRAIGSGVLKLFTPLTVGLGAVAAAAAVGVTAYANYLISIKQVETAASGFGRAVAGTAAEMEASAQAGAAAAGISVSAARSMQAEFLQSGKIGSEHYEGLIALSKDFAATAGIDAASAGQALTEMFADPAKAAQTLNREYGLIDAATARRVTNLAAQNRVSEAQGVLLDALPDKLANAERATTALGRAWNAVATAAGNAMDWMGKAADRVVSGPSSTERIAEIDRLLNLPKRADGRNARIDRDALERERRELQTELDAEKARREEAERNRLGSVSLGIAEGSGANSSAAKERELRNQIEALQRGRGSFSEGSDERGMVDSAIEAKTRALDALINRQARSAELDQLDIQIANERNPLLRADLEARRTRLEMADQEVSAERINEEAAKARNRVITETIASSAAQADDMRAEVEVRQRLAAQVASGAITQTDANRLLQEELALRPLVAAAAAAEGEEKAKLNAVIDDLRKGYSGLADTERAEAAQSILKSQSENLAQLRAEIALVGETEAVRRRSLAMFQAEQDIKRAGIPTNSAWADQIRRQADEEERLRLSLEKSTDAWDRYRSAGEGAIDTIFDGLASGDFDFKSIGKDLVSDLSKSFIELSVKNPLKNMMFGTNYGTMSDLLGGKQSGGLLSSIFGNGTGAMTVNAATVMINGGVTGGLGALLGGSSSAGGLIGSAANSNGSRSGSAVDLMSGLLGASETTNASSINSFLRAGGVDLNAATTAWCAGFVNSALKQVGVSGTGSALANSFQNWGTKVDVSQLIRGDVLLQTNGGSATSQGGHVGLATGASRVVAGQTQLQMISGNSGDAVANSWVKASEVQIRRSTEAAGALGNLSNGLNDATGGLASFGSGLGKFGQTLGSALSGGNGGLASLLGSFTSAGISAFNTSSQFASAVLSGKGGLWDSGGYTGAGDKYDVAGLVHRDEFVFSKEATRAIGVATLDRMHTAAKRGRGFASGGSTSSAIGITPLPAAAFSANDNAGRTVGSNQPRSANIKVSLEGARGDAEIEQAAYRGMHAALREYDAGMDDRIAEHNANPRWRKAI